jgi:Heterokaryon incompatibility protein (HET)
LQTINSSSTGSSPYFQLLHEWLRNCNQNPGHEECRRPNKYWPTRVVFVGGPDPDILKLVERQGADRIGDDYVVLSHCWGTPTTEEKERFCTIEANYRDRLKGFSYNDLPKTFQDAVRVTRELHKEYLWIDSLCIIQENPVDWQKEAGEMENVFASAYCTIAASSAPNWNDGFLKRDLESQYIEIQDVSGNRLYACDFDKDVDEGALAKRAWVLQERVLSRRIIHFSAGQTYWECGFGVRCENFTKLKW